MTEPLGDSQKDAIEKAVQQFIEAQLDGRQADVEGFVKRFPDIEDQIRRRLRYLQEIDGLFSGLMDTDENGSGSPAAENDLVGKRLGDFEILRLIGTGGMGAVFLAHQISLDRNVAIKVVSDIGGARSRVAERFKREATTLAQLSHPNIVPIYEVGQEGPYFYFAMEHVAGFSLDVLLDWIRKASRQEKASDILRRCLGGQYDSFAITNDPGKGGDATIDTDYIVAVGKMMVSIALALEYAHQKGILHRDIKPSNILIDTNGTPKLVDFGLARLQTQESLTVTGEFFGTPSYTSPEQVRAPEKVDCRSDVYSLAATYYECLTLQPPFKADTVNETLTKVLFTEPTPPRKQCPRLSNDFNVVLLHALEKRPEDRYQTAAEFANDIENVLDFKPIEAKRPSLTQRSYRALRRNQIKVIVCVISFVAIAFGLLLCSVHMQDRDRTAADALRQKALHQIQLGKDAEALEYYSQAISKHSTSVDLYREMGQCYNRLGQYEQAASVYERAAAIRPTNAAVCNALGQVYERLGAYEKAVDVYRKAAQIDPNDFLAYSLLGAVLEILHRDKEALIACQQAIEINRMYVVPYINMGEIYQRNGQHEEARQAFVKAIALEPKHPGSYNALGLVYGALGRHEEAIQVLQRAMDLRPDDPTVYSNLGLAYAESGRHGEAVEALRRAVSLAPNDPVNFNGLGIVYGELGRHDEAIQAFEAAIKLEPDNAAHYSGLAEEYLELRRDLDAIRALQRSIQIHPTCLAYNRLAAALEGMGRDGEAEDAYAQALKLDPNNWLTYSNIAVRRGDAGRLEDAIAAAERAIAIDPNHGLTYANLALYLNRLGRCERAVQVCQRSIAIDAGYSPAYEQLGFALIRLGRRDDALAACQEAVKLDPNSTSALEGLASVYTWLGRYEEAAVACESLIRGDPNSIRAYSLLWQAHTELQHFEKAIEALTQACRLSGYKDHFGLASLAKACADVGRWDQAIEYQEKAIGLLADWDACGLGMAVEVYDSMTITSVVPGTPAWESGLVVGDVIRAIDGVGVNDMALDGLAAAIQGPEGTRVTLSVQRRGQPTVEEVTLARMQMRGPVLSEYRKRLTAYMAHVDM
jgi:tetratricopeptide (TPR) repeat protein